MAVAASRPRSHERLLARFHGKRSTTPPAASPSSAVVPSNLVNSSTVTVMAVILTILLLAIFGFAAWRIVLRKRKQNARSSLVSIASDASEKVLNNRNVPAIVIYSEKPEAAAWEEKDVATTPVVIASWVPQTKDGRVLSLQFPEPVQEAGDISRSKSMWKKLAQTVHSPPPTYLASIGPMVRSKMSRMDIPPPPPPPSAALPDIPPPTPPASLKLFIPATPVASITSPLRSASIQPFPVPVPAGAARNSTHKLARLMAVGTTFSPSLDDELSLEAGEIVRMLEEYEDEWCLAQRVGRADAEKGVVPRFCLVERVQIIPTHKHRSRI